MTRSTSPRFSAPLALLSLAFVGCTTAPARTIPDPLPETLAWAIPETKEAAFLGLDVRENDTGSLESLSFDPGVRVQSVIERSPAATTGIEIGDVVLSANGVELAVPGDLTAVLGGLADGDRVALKVQRGDAVFDVEVTVVGGSEADAPTVREDFVLDPARSLGAWGTNQGAVLVARNEDGPLKSLDLGTRVVALDGDPIVTGRGLVARLVALDPGTSVMLTVVDPGSMDERDVKVRLLSEGRRTTRFSVPVLTTYDAPADGVTTDFVFIDLYLISLFRYAREGKERRYRFLRFFQWSSGVGELEAGN